MKTPQGEVTEILNSDLAGAKNVLGTLRWLKSGETFQPESADKHQLIYLMEGNGNHQPGKQGLRSGERRGRISGPVRNRDDSRGGRRVG